MDVYLDLHFNVPWYSSFELVVNVDLLHTLRIFSMISSYKSVSIDAYILPVGFRSSKLDHNLATAVLKTLPLMRLRLVVMHHCCERSLPFTNETCPIGSLSPIR